MAAVNEERDNVAGIINHMEANGHSTGQESCRPEVGLQAQARSKWIDYKVQGALGC